MESGTCVQHLKQGTGQPKKRGHLRKTSLLVLTSSPPARIGSHGGQAIPGEVKKSYEGDTTLIKVSRQLDGQPIHHNNRDYHCGTTTLLGENMKKNTQQKQLPPLPKRALTRLPEPWVSPEGGPFHTVHLWEFTNLYVILDKKMWTKVSSFLQSQNLAALGRRWKITRSILSNIRDNQQQSISVATLRKLCYAAQLDFDKVESSLKAVRFNQSGDLEHLSFPFSMDLYTWRVLCHIAGDGNIYQKKDRPYPSLRWTQAIENQQFMRELLKRLSRECQGKTMNINYPKALTYAMLGTIPNLTIFDLRSPKFIQFVLDLPLSYHDFKVQFLTAFIVDDGCISKDVSFSQKDPESLTLIMCLCDQLGYDHSPLYRQKRDDVHSFQLRIRGIRSYQYDLMRLYNKDKIFGLWHKQDRLDLVIQSFSNNRKIEQDFSSFVCVKIIQILQSNGELSTDKIQNHPGLCHFLDGFEPYWLKKRLRFLKKMGLIEEILNPKTQKSYRPKHWKLPQNATVETLVKRFHQEYNVHSHSHSYKRRNITVKMVKDAIATLKSQGQNCGALAVSRLIGCSKKQLYQRQDLRKYFTTNQVLE